MCDSKRYFIESDYPEFWVTQIRKKRWVEPYLDYFFKLLEIDKDDLILEIGVGEGRLIDKVIKEEAVYVGIDISRRILKYAKQKLRENDTSNIVHLVVADAELLPFRDRAFDGCFCIGTLFFIPDGYKAIREMGRTAKKKLVIEFRNALSPALIRHRLKTHLRNTFHEIKLKAKYATLKSPPRKLADIMYGVKRVNRAVLNLEQYFAEKRKNCKQPYFPMSPLSVTRAFKLANLQILNVTGFELPEYSSKPIPHYSILKWLKPTLIINARPM